MQDPTVFLAFLLYCALSSIWISHPGGWLIASVVIHRHVCTRLANKLYCVLRRVYWCSEKSLFCPKNILPCVHFPAGAFFLEKKTFSVNCKIKIIENRKQLHKIDKTCIKSIKKCIKSITNV